VHNVWVWAVAGIGALKNGALAECLARPSRHSPPWANVVAKIKNLYIHVTPPLTKPGVVRP
jgi:hypothetical protein